MKNTSTQDWVERLARGEVSMHTLPDTWSETDRARVRLSAVSRVVENTLLADPIQESDVLEKAQGRNCENMIGGMMVPLGVVGPVHFENEKPIYIPLATTEGALVASVQRGTKAIEQAGDTTFYIKDRGMTRAPVFVVDTIAKAHEVEEFLAQPDSLTLLGKLARQTSTHLTLFKMHTKLVGRNLFVKFFFDTGAAMGMNMVTLATEKLSLFLENTFQIRCASLSGNGCVDKKPSWGSVLEGRGFYVQAQTIIPKDVLEKVLKVQPRAIAEVAMRKNYVGGAAFGSMGFNAHYANMVAAFYLATGQDMAHVVEGSIGVTTVEEINEDMYFSVTLPNVLLGVVGGGTHLPYQKRSLSMMRIDQASVLNKQQLARCLSYVVMAGELSLLASLASGTLASAHAKHGRRGRQN